MTGKKTVAEFVRIPILGQWRHRNSDKFRYGVCRASFQRAKAVLAAFTLSPTLTST